MYRFLKDIIEFFVYAEDRFIDKERIKKKYIVYL